jgi:MFS family permease
MTQLPEGVSNTPGVPRLPFARLRVFYGWIIVFVGFVNQIAQGLVNQGFSAYADVLSADFGWSKAVLAGPRSITSVQNSILGPLTGYMVDRFGPRIVVGAGMTITGLGLIVLGMTNSLFTYYVANVLMALGLSVGGMLVMSVAVNNWFRRHATLAQSLMLLGFSLAGVFGVPLLVFLQTSIGWRHSATWTGIAVIAIALPCSLLLRARPENFGLLPDGEPPEAQAQSIGRVRPQVEHTFTLRQAVRTRAFWLLAFGWSVISLGTGVVQVHLFLHLGKGIGGVGLERTAIAVVWSVASISNIPARLIGGILGDRLPKNLTLGAAGLLMAGSVFALAMTTSFATTLLFAVPYGIGWGMSTPVMNSAQGEYFGRRSLGAIRGSLQLAALPFTIAAPVLVGHMADSQGTYQWAFVVMASVMVVGASLVFLAKRPGAPKKEAPR